MPVPSYTTLVKSVQNDTSGIWPGVTITDRTAAARRQLKNAMDAFTTFSWRGAEAFKSFGAFISADKPGDLKFYNGPGFSNEYSKPQFSQYTNLLGVNLNTQTISFKIGVYWIDIDTYRKFLDWLNPFIIDTLAFGFDNQYCYQVKLSKIQDSPRYIVGHEKRDNDSVPMYYTEFTLGFEVQGQACARTQRPYNWKYTVQNSTPAITGGSHGLEGVAQLTEDFTSDLDVPFTTSFGITLKSGQGKSFSTDGLKLNIQYEFVMPTDKTITLFDITLHNLTWLATKVGSTESSIPTPANDTAQRFNLVYDSEAGVIYVHFGDEQYQLLSLLNTVQNGNKFVDHMWVSKFLLPGRFSTRSLAGFDVKDCKLRLKIMAYVVGTDNQVIESALPLTLLQDDKSQANMTIECYGRTNII